MLQILQVFDRVLHHDLSARPASTPHEPVVTGKQAGTGTCFGTRQMSGVKWSKSGGMQSRRSGPHLRVNLDYDMRATAPATDLCAAVRQRMLRVLELQNLRPSELVQTVGESLQDGEDRRCFHHDPLLTLVIERPVEAVEIQIKAHSWLSLAS
jgi:hypothetical protein